jgi:hypothetical protein
LAAFVALIEARADLGPAEQLLQFVGSALQHTDAAPLVKPTVPCLVRLPFLHPSVQPRCQTLLLAFLRLKALFSETDKEAPAWKLALSELVKQSELHPDAFWLAEAMLAFLAAPYCPQKEGL